MLAPKHQVVAKNATINTNGAVVGAAYGVMSNHALKNVVVFVTVANAPTGTTPSLTLNLQGSGDGTNFATIASSAAITAATGAGVAVRFAAPNVVDPFLRITASLSGTTPSFTGVSIDVFESSDS